MVTIYECDFCKEQKACRKIQVENKDFDICPSCEKKLTKKLEGRGEAKLQPVPVIYHHWYNSNWPYYQPTIINPLPLNTPTITWSTTSQATGEYVGNSGTVTGSSTSNSLCLTGTTTQ